MFGLLLLAIFVGYIWLAAFAIRHTHGLWRLHVLAIAVLIPTWDSLFGRWVLFPIKCRNAGAQVYQSGSLAGGILLPRKADSIWLDTYRFAFVEWVDFDKRAFRLDRTNGMVEIQLNYRPALRDGVLVVEGGEAPRAAVEFQSTDTNSFSDMLRTRTLRIVSRPANKIVSESVNYHVQGGWVHQALGGSRVASCQSDSDQLRDLIAQTFRYDKRQP